MDISKLTEICDNGCNPKKVVVASIEHSSIKKKTIRSKGQMTSQRLFYIRGGECKFVLNNKKTILAKKGDILYLPPDATYTSYWNESEDSAAYTVIFDLYSNGNALNLSKKMIIVANDKFGIYLKLFEDMLSVFNEGHIGYKIKCQSVLLDILFMLIHELIGSSDKKENRPIYKGILYIENNYMSDIDVNEIANMCSMSPSSFRSKFTKITGMSPIKYKNCLKMKKAAELLKGGELNAEQVSAELGIDDPYYFSRLFKSFYGVPPGKYKRG